jgi:hypothetical protein
MLRETYLTVVRGLDPTQTPSKGKHLQLPCSHLIWRFEFSKTFSFIIIHYFFHIPFLWKTPKTRNRGILFLVPTKLETAYYLLRLTTFKVSKRERNKPWVWREYCIPIILWRILGARQQHSQAGRGLEKKEQKHYCRFSFFRHLNIFCL